MCGRRLLVGCGSMRLERSHGGALDNDEDINEYDMQAKHH